MIVPFGHAFEFRQEVPTPLRRARLLNSARRKHQPAPAAPHRAPQPPQNTAPNAPRRARLLTYRSPKRVRKILAMTGLRPAGTGGREGPIFCRQLRAGRLTVADRCGSRRSSGNRLRASRVRAAWYHRRLGPISQGKPSGRSLAQERVPLGKMHRGAPPGFRSVFSRIPAAHPK